MRTGVKLLEEAKALQEFWGYFLFAELGLYRGVKNPKLFVSEYLRGVCKGQPNGSPPAASSGADELEDAVRPETVRCLFDYISLTSLIGKFACDRADRGFKPEQLKVVQVRADFDFGAWMIRLLFIIDADPQSEMSFSDLLARIERIISQEGSFLPQLMYVNKRSQTVDSASVRQNYPFVGKFRSGG
jgi:hypothetical protein